MVDILTYSENNHQFKVKAKSGDTLLTSIQFSNKSKLEKIIEKLSSLSMTRDHFERQTNTEGKFLFSLHDEDGNTIGHSEPYDSEAGMENGIKNLRASIEG